MVKLDSPRRERILERFLEEELRESFIDYSMSVIVQRALPDARDGLKPVQRRILFAMHELGLAPDRAHKKCATVVGDVLGKYHPHGDVTVYDTLVRLAQDFSMRYELIDGQGNFGSIDGDPAAAYRYTEARLAPIASDLLRDIEKDTVDFRPNFDGRLQEPVVLPSAFPQLLVNGSDGIAVGMATKVPPHNLREIAAAVMQLLSRPNSSVNKLLEIVDGPDFPTGAFIWGRAGIEEAYKTGRGRIVMRARAHIEQGAYGKPSLVVTELPYQVSKQRVVENIAQLARRGQLDGLTDLRDESDRDGVRIVLELRRDADPRAILEKLFRKTKLQSTFGVIILALVDGVPTQLNLKEAIAVWIDHRLSVIRRRARFNLAGARERAHILKGLLIAVQHIDEVVDVIRSSRTPETAAKKLRITFKLTARQADAILAMRLSRLTHLENRKLRDELGAVNKRIRTLVAILADQRRRRALVRRELAAVTLRFADARRTEILSDSGRFPLPSGGAELELHVFLTRMGYLKSVPARNGQRDGGLSAAESLEEARRSDFVTRRWLCKSDDQLLAFSRDGRVYAMRVGDLTQGTRSSRGRHLTDELNIDEEPVAIHVVREFSADRFVVTVTRKGRVKRTPLAEYRNIRSGGIVAATVERGDEIIDARITNGQDDLILATRAGQAIRFQEPEVRPTGRSAVGVKGITLSGKDEVVALAAAGRDARLLAVTAHGFAKRMRTDGLRVQSRGGKGVRLLPAPARTGDLIGLLDVLPDDTVIALTESGAVIPLGYEGSRTERPEAHATHEGPAPRQAEGRTRKRPSFDRGSMLELGSGKVVAVDRAPIWRGAPETGETQMSLQI